jgi:hypothetical protein
MTSKIYPAFQNIFEKKFDQFENSIRAKKSLSDFKIHLSKLYIS